MPPPRYSIPVLMFAAALGFSGCAQYASISEKKPHFTPIRSTLATLDKAEQGIVHALVTSRRDPLAALGGYLSAAQNAGAQLQRTPNNVAARDDYNFAVARVFDALKSGKLDPWTQPLRVPSPEGGEYLFTRAPDPRKAWNPALYDFSPADKFEVGGTYVQKREIKAGVGAPLVVIGRDANVNAAANFALPKTYYGVTAVLRFEGRRAIMSFEDPLASEKTRLGERTFPLAADFTVPVAVMLASTNPKLIELARAFRPEKFAKTARIVKLQPYDPNKTVVLFVHGLVDSPATWAPMIMSLRSDPRLREKYQFWYYSYPSGYPYPYSASILRHQLDGAEKKYPLCKPMVMVGHSMGSCISRLLITDADEKLWFDYFGKPPTQVRMSPASKAIFTDALIFHHRPEVGRVIFIAGPHRGSDLASNWFGRFASSLVKAPETLLGAGRDALGLITARSDGLKLKRIPNSVDTLAPNNRFVRTINTIPITPGIPYHSIMGDRGKGGNKDHTPPVSSDGVVPYWSSHLDGAQSELIVPSTHSAHQNPLAIAEVRRILRQHAGIGASN